MHGHFGSINSWLSWSNVPRVKLTKRCNLPWLSKNHKRAMQKCNQLLRWAHKTGSARLMNLYKPKRIEVTKLLRNSKKAYSSNSKHFWKTVRLLKGDNRTIPTLLILKMTMRSHLTEILSDHFVKSFNNCHHPYPPWTSS